MNRHIEMIIEYVENNEDYQYYDNHGLLIRCNRCVYSDGKRRRCTNPDREGVSINEDDYCSRAKLRDVNYC